MHYPSVNIWPPISGISFMLITVRIGLGWAWGGRGPPAAIYTSHHRPLGRGPLSGLGRERGQSRASAEICSPPANAGGIDKWSRAVVCLRNVRVARPSPRPLIGRPRMHV